MVEGTSFINMIIKARIAKLSHLSTPQWCKLEQDHLKERSKNSERTTQNKRVVIVQEMFFSDDN